MPLSGHPITVAPVGGFGQPLQGGSGTRCLGYLHYLRLEHADDGDGHRPGPGLDLDQPCGPILPGWKHVTCLQSDYLSTIRLSLHQGKPVRSRNCFEPFGQETTPETGCRRPQFTKCAIPVHPNQRSPENQSAQLFEPGCRGHPSPFSSSGFPRVPPTSGKFPIPHPSGEPVRPD